MPADRAKRSIVNLSLGRSATMRRPPKILFWPCSSQSRCLSAHPMHRRTGRSACVCVAAGASEIVPIPTETEGAAFDRARQRLTLCDWCHGPDASKHWLLSDSAACLIVDERGQALYADTVIPMPGPVVVAAYIQAGVACLGTETGELAVWHLADRAEKVGGRDLGVPITCLAVSDTAQTLAVACDDSFIRGRFVEKIFRTWDSYRGQVSLEMSTWAPISWWPRLATITESAPGIWRPTH